MSRKIVILLIVGIIVTSMVLLQCGKSTVSPLKINEQLLGKWQWVSSIGGFAGWTLTPATEGYDKMLIFDSYSTFISRKIDSTGIENTNGSYTIAYEKIWNVNDSGDVIYMDGFLRSEMEIENDTLFLTDICYDCFGHKYVKIEGL